MSRPYIENRYATDEEWAEARKGGIGGSDVASIMGINPYSSPLEVWLVKTGRAESPDLSGKESVEWGNRLEPLVAEKFAEGHPELKVRRKNCTMASVSRPWAFANIDRELRGPDGSHGVLEIKTVGSRRSSDWDDGVPAYYMTQVQHYLSVTGWGFAWVAVLIGGQEYREFLVPRDEEDIAAIDSAVDAFWNEYVAKDVMPQIVGTDSESRALFDQHQSDDGEYEYEADYPLLQTRVALKEELDAKSAELKQIDNEIKARIGDAKGIEDASLRATWVRTESAQFDKASFQADNPELYAKYMVRKPKDMGLRFKKMEV